MAYKHTRAKRLLEAVGMAGTPDATPESTPPPPPPAGTEGRKEMEAKQKQLEAERDRLRRQIATADRMLGFAKDEDRGALEAEIKRLGAQLSVVLAELGEVDVALRGAPREEKGEGESAETINLEDPVAAPAAFRPVPGTVTGRIGGTVPFGTPDANGYKAPEAKKPRFARVDVDELRDYATFLNVLRSRVKLLVNLIDDADLEFASDAWKERKSGPEGDFTHPLVLDGTKFGHPYHTVRTWLEQYRLFPDVLSSAFVSVLSSIDALRTRQRKDPIPFWALVREPHLSTFAKWIGHQHLHDQQLANQWGGRSEGHIALAMSTRDALSYFEQLP
jgi:hypothetical protein